MGKCKIKITKLVLNSLPAAILNTDDLSVRYE
jgi:hypothetical protein